MDGLSWGLSAEGDPPAVQAPGLENPWRRTWQPSQRSCLEEHTDSGALTMESSEADSAMNNNKA